MGVCLDRRSLGVGNGSGDGQNCMDPLGEKLLLLGWLVNWMVVYWLVNWLVWMSWVDFNVCLFLMGVIKCKVC